MPETGRGFLAAQLPRLDEAGGLFAENPDPTCGGQNDRAVEARKTVGDRDFAGFPRARGEIWYGQTSQAGTRHDNLFLPGRNRRRPKHGDRGAYPADPDAPFRVGEDAFHASRAPRSFQAVADLPPIGKQPDERPGRADPEASFRIFGQRARHDERNGRLRQVECESAKAIAPLLEHEEAVGRAGPDPPPTIPVDPPHAVGSDVVSQAIGVNRRRRRRGFGHDETGDAGARGQPQRAVRNLEDVAHDRVREALRDSEGHEIPPVETGESVARADPEKASRVLEHAVDLILGEPVGHREDADRELPPLRGRGSRQHGGGHDQQSAKSQGSHADAFTLLPPADLTFRAEPLSFAVLPLEAPCTPFSARAGNN